MSDVDENLLKEENNSSVRSERVDDFVDPRIQVELERLNTATDLINKLETELNETRSNFRILLSESSIRVNQLAKKIGSCVEKSRPYYEARMKAKQLQTQTQKAALRFERSSSAHAAAKEMVFLAEEGLMEEGRCFDPAWQEMLNHATLRVNESENERVFSQHEHQKTSMAYNEAEKHVQQLHQELRKSIIKSSLSTRRSLLQLNNLANQHQLQLLPYFEMKAQFNQLLEEQRKKVHHLEENVLKIKMNYADALHNLEEISDEIHQKRKCENVLKSSMAELCSPTSENLKSSYQKLKSSPSISEDFSVENINADDQYINLPSHIKLSPGMIPKNIDDDGKYHFASPSSVDENSITDQSFSSREETLVANGIKFKENKFASEILLPASNSSDFYNSPNFLGHKDRSLMGNEEGPDERFFIADLNVLKIQQEISDSESVASNDTLDDNQIECLLLEKTSSLNISTTDINGCEKNMFRS